MLEQNHTPPIVPRRPKKQQDSSIDGIEPDRVLEVSSSGPSNNRAVEGAEEPVIPHRPMKTKKIVHEDLPTPTIPKRPVKAGSSSKDSRSSSDVVHETVDENLDPAITQPQVDEVNKAEPLLTSISLEEEHGSVLNSQRDNGDGMETDLDGDRTPGNSKTKITFKDDIDDEAATGGLISDVSSFNDDVETVSQEKEDEEELNRQQTSEQPSEPILRSKDEHAVENIKEELNKGKENQEASEGQDPSKAVLDSGPIAESTGNDSDTLSTELLATNQPLNIPIMPKIPYRPAFNKNSILKSNDDVFAEKETDSASAADSTVVSPATEENSDIPEIERSLESKPTTPIIPSRPKKNTLGPVATLKDLDMLSETSSKPKAPPPKPKKLSSKIAAFQQMFNEDDKPPSPSTQPAHISPVVGSNPLRGKLSNDKMKFAESLKGFMGRGIPLPGMVNPNPSELTADAKDEDELSSPVTLEGKSLDTSSQRTRARPKGKRLPKSLKEPVAIDVKARFQIAIHELWDLKFEKAEEAGVGNAVVPGNSRPMEGDAANEPESQDGGVLLEDELFNGRRQPQVVDSIKAVLEEEESTKNECAFEPIVQKKSGEENDEEIYEAQTIKEHENDSQFDTHHIVKDTIEDSFLTPEEPETKVLEESDVHSVENGNHGQVDDIEDALSDYQHDEGTVKDLVIDVLVPQDLAANKKATGALPNDVENILSENHHQVDLTEEVHDKTDVTNQKKLLEGHDE